MNVSNIQENIAEDAPRARAIRLLQTDILNGRWLPETRLPAGKKLAARFGVCRSTIRAALVELETQEVVAHRRNFGYFVRGKPAPVDDLVASTIAVISDDARHPQRQFFSGEEIAFESGVIDTVFGAGLNALTLHANQFDEIGFDRLVSRRPKGIVVACRFQDPAQARTLLASIAARSVPVAFYGDEPDFAPFDRVASDHRGGTRELVRWLAGRGCRRILRLWTPAPSTPWLHAHDAGYEEAARECGIESLPAAYVEGLPWRITGSLDVFQRRTRQFAGYMAEHLTGPRPVDAVMVCTDCEVFPLAAACRLLGREPGRDLLITGYDNTWRQAFEREWEATYPAATVEKHNHLIGETIAQLLLDRIAGRLPDAPQCRIIPQEFMVTAEEPAVRGMMPK